MGAVLSSLGYVKIRRCTYSLACSQSSLREPIVGKEKSYIHKTFFLLWKIKMRHMALFPIVIHALIYPSIEQ